MKNVCVHLGSSYGLFSLGTIEKRRLHAETGAMCAQGFIIHVKQRAGYLPVVTWIKQSFDATNVIRGFLEIELPDDSRN